MALHEMRKILANLNLSLACRAFKSSYFLCRQLWWVSSASLSSSACSMIWSGVPPSASLVRCVRLSFSKAGAGKLMMW